MKIINRTHFQTRDLRRIFTRCADLVLKEEKKRHVCVTVVYARQSRGASGCAIIGGYHATVRINKHDPKPATVAAVTVHEFRHLNGWSHKEMCGTYKGEDARYVWANDLGIRVREPKPKRRPTDDIKLAHAQVMYVRACSRVRRAQTIQKTWLRKVRYYSRKMAATSRSKS